MPLGASAVASEICEWHRCTSGWNRCILLSLIVNIRSSFTHLHSSSLTHLHSSSISSCLCSCHSSQKSHHFFRFYQQNKSSEFIVSSDRLVIIAKGFLKLPKLHMLIKQDSITSQKPGSRDFWRISNSALTKGRFAIPSLFNGPELLPSASDKAKLWAKKFSKNSNLVDSGNSSPVSLLQLI